MSLTALVRRVPFAERGHVAHYNAFAFCGDRQVVGAADSQNATAATTGMLDGWTPDTEHAFIEIGVGPLGVLRLSLAEAADLRDALAHVLGESATADGADSQQEGR